MPKSGQCYYIYSGEMPFFILLLDADEEIELMKAFCADEYNLCPI